MEKIIATLLTYLENLAVFVAFTLISFFLLLYAIIRRWIPPLPLSTVITFNQLVSAFIYAVLVSSVITSVYHRWRRRR